MGRGSSGFTIIELMIVVTIIVIIATIAVPSLISARMTANEVAAIETLRSICTAQQQFLKSNKADEDFDATGEYGSLGELSGAAGVRGGSSKVPTDLTGSMSNVSVAGEVSKSSYIFRMYLPDSNGHGLRENPGGGFNAGVLDPNNAEGYWCCYAVPGRYGISGRRTFFVNQMGEIFFTESKDYSGPNCLALQPGASYQTSNLLSITGRTAMGTAGADGNTWRPVK